MDRYLFNNSALQSTPDDIYNENPSNNNSFNSSFINNNTINDNTPNINQAAQNNKQSNIILDSSDEDQDSDNSNNNDNNNNNKSKKKIKENDPKFIWEIHPINGPYLLRKNCFLWHLLPPTKKDRTAKFTCTVAKCTWSTILPIKNFQSSNLARHYKNKHKKLPYNQATEDELTTPIEQPENSIAQQLMAANSNKRQGSSNLDFNINTAYRLSLTFAIKNNIPFNAIYSKEFRELLQYHNYKAPRIHQEKLYKTLNMVVKEHLYTLNNEFEDHLRNNGKFSFILDIWTSITGRPYFGIIVNYIDKNWDMKYKTIGFDYITGSHKGTNIYARFNNIRAQYKCLPDNRNIISYTRDNASNNNTFLKALFLSLRNQTQIHTLNKTEFFDIRCAAHIINLVARDCCNGFAASKSDRADINLYYNNPEAIQVLESRENNNELEEEDDILDALQEAINEYTDGAKALKKFASRVRKHATFYKFNQATFELLLEGIQICKAKNEMPQNYNKTRIPIDGETRWNSTDRMLGIFLEMLPATKYIYKNTNSATIKSVQFNEEELDYLLTIKGVFEIFKEPSTRLQAELKTTISESIIDIYDIFKKLREYKGWLEIIPLQNELHIANQGLILGIEKGQQKLRKYFPEYPTINDFPLFKPFFLGVILNPTYKTSYFESGKSLHFFPNIKEMVINLLKEEYNKLNTILNAKKTAQELINPPKSKSVHFIPPPKIDEVDKYLHEPQEDNDPLITWKTDCRKYPILSILARHYLQIAATSAPVERQFSKSAHVITKLRNRLSHRTIKKIMLLKSWIETDIRVFEKELQDLAYEDINLAELAEVINSDEDLAGFLSSDEEGETFDKDTANKKN